MATSKPPEDETKKVEQTCEQATPEQSGQSSVSEHQHISILESADNQPGQNPDTPSPAPAAAVMFDPSKIEEGEHIAGGNPGAMPPRETSGLDAETRGRGAPRKYATAEEAKEAKRRLDRERRARQNGNTVSSPGTANAPAVDKDALKRVQAKSGARVISTALDMVCNILSAGEYQHIRDATVDAAFVEATEEYLMTTNGTVPPWALVLVLGAAKVLPATSTPTARGRLSGLWAKLRGWWVARRG